MKQGSLEFDKSTIHYSRWGEGQHLLIAIPGFGETSISYTCIGEKLPSKYSLIAFDLPFHGSTTWREAPKVEPKQLSLLITELCRHCGVSDARYTLIGYSMGARIALSIYEAAPEKIQHLLLLAPDGLSTHFIYWVSTQTLVGNRLFKWTMHHPQPFLRVGEFAQRAGLLPENSLRFAKRYMQQETSRKQVYEIWTAFRKCKPNRKKISSWLRQHQTPVTLIFGKNDPMIQLNQGEAFRRRAGKNIRLEILDAGHQLLQEKHALQICSLIETGNQVNLKQ